jgi:NO-binding membrane sensor protein with MHYT domain
MYLHEADEQLLLVRLLVCRTARFAEFEILSSVLVAAKQGKIARTTLRHLSATKAHLGVRSSFFVDNQNAFKDFKRVIEPSRRQWWEGR